MNWFARLLNKRRLEAELGKELQYHLDRQIRDYVEAGLTEEEARRRAHLEFGGPEQVRERCREVRGTLWLDSVLKDVRLALRLFRKSPVFTIAAIGTLALGIGANTAIFRLLDAVRLRALPARDPQQLALVQLADRTGWRGSQVTLYPALTNPIWERFRDTQQAFSGVLAWGNNDFNIAPGDESRIARGMFVSGDFSKSWAFSPCWDAFSIAPMTIVAAPYRVR
jgi:putative ABC transport system permease protein